MRSAAPVPFTAERPRARPPGPGSPASPLSRAIAQPGNWSEKGRGPAAGGSQASLRDRGRGLAVREKKNVQNRRKTLRRQGCNF